MNNYLFSWVACIGIILIAFLVFDIFGEIKYVGDFDAFMEVAKEKYPDSIIFQQSKIGQFIRIDSQGNLISFVVWDIDDKTIVGEKILTNLNNLQY